MIEQIPLEQLEADVEADIEGDEVIDVPAVEAEASSERAESDVARDPEAGAPALVEAAQQPKTFVLLPKPPLPDRAISD